MAPSANKMVDVPWRASLYFGVALMVLSLTGRLIFVNLNLAILNSWLLGPCFAVGAVLSLAPILHMFLDRRGPSPGESITTDTSSWKTRYMLKVEKPKVPTSKRVDAPVSLSGTIKKPLPTDGQIELWLFNFGSDGYWPHERVSAKERTWSVQYTPSSYRDGDARRLRVYFVGKDGQALIRYYFKANKGRSGDWVPLVDKTADMIAASDELEVKLIKAEAAETTITKPL